MKWEKGTLLQDRYSIEALIGEGGMSYVYRARDQKLGRTVAIKVLKQDYAADQEFVRKFQDEAKAAVKLNHLNIVSAYDVVDEGDTHFIVMELVEGITLKNYIHRKGKCSEREAIGIALQLVEGMDTAHKMGIVHRDIKPQNMIVSTEGVVKIADFGIDRAASQETANTAVPYIIFHRSRQDEGFPTSVPIFIPWVAPFMKCLPESFPMPERIPWRWFFPTWKILFPG